MRILLVFLYFMIFTLAVVAQEDFNFEQDSAAHKSSKVYYGGYLNLSFGTYTVVGAQPLVAYKVTSKFSLGTQLTYEYFSNKYSGERYSSSNYGASIFSRYRFIPQLYAHTEFSTMNYDLSYYSDGDSREWIPFLFVGGGYSQPVSANIWLNAQVLFDVIQHENSPYADWEPFFSVGFGVGF